MPIILPKCKKDYELNRSSCSCKKKKPKTQKKKKVIIKKPKTQKKKKKAASKKQVKKLSFLEKQKGPIYFKNKFKQDVLNKWSTGIDTKWIERYGPAKARCKKGFMKNPLDKYCYTWSDDILKKYTQKTKPRELKKPKPQKKKPKTKKKSRCNIKKIKTKKKKKVSKKTATKKLKTILKSIVPVSKIRSYSPEINKLLTRINISPHKDIFGYCEEDEIFDKTTKKCYRWKDKKAENILLDNLKSKKPIKGSNILGPVQNQSNCWFNSFFMTFFISDKARKFMKSFRHFMITGKKHKNDKSYTNNSYRYPFWLLNKFITASLLGKSDPMLFASMMDTNNIIKTINSNLPGNYNGTFYKKVGEAGNPIVMFFNIFKFLNGCCSTNDFSIKLHYIDEHYSEYHGLFDKSSQTYKYMNVKKPDIIIVDITDSKRGNDIIPNTGNTAYPKNFKKKLDFTIGNMKYKLDSICLRDVNKQHICALITINGEDYMFDGENNTPLYKNKWRHYLNKNQNFKITPNISETYNLTKNYQSLIYYRTK